MPIYEYRHTHKTGETCEETFEIFQKMADDALTTCPVCGHPVEKILSRFSGGADKLAPSRLKELGFSKWVRRDKGTYERE
ncbi:MAG: zinc ribbon domain-containing protein [Planctomycetes bacterium]|nr:zinc ribbon domain-containing protein [Planctomycetota bacterium]MCB9934977.1 zinc ribbon domain-containing protein [Planctomycetota bacterium]